VVSFCSHHFVYLHKDTAVKATGFILACLLAARTLCAQEVTDTTSNTLDSVKDTLIRIEHEWGNAMIKGDVAAFSRCVAHEWVLTYSDGSIVTKPMAQTDLSEGALKIESFRLDDVNVRVYGDAAIVSGLITEKSKFRDKDTSGRRRFTDVFVKREGRWQAVASHESDVSVEPATRVQSGDVAKVLMALENAWVDALVKADTAKLDEILVDTYADTEDMHQSDKQATLAVLKSGDLKFKSIKLSNMKVYAFDNAAVVTGMAAQDGTFKGHPIEPKLVFTDTFVLQNGMWKAVASHRTTGPK
jgi:ketosteroid isomerase-like protein